MRQNRWARNNLLLGAVLGLAAAFVAGYVRGVAVGHDDALDSTRPWILERDFLR